MNISRKLFFLFVLSLSTSFFVTDYIHASFWDYFSFGSKNPPKAEQPAVEPPSPEEAPVEVQLPPKEEPPVTEEIETPQEEAEAPEMPEVVDEEVPPTDKEEETPEGEAEAEESINQETLHANQISDPHTVTVPYGTTLQDLKKTTTPPPQATFQIYEEDEKTVAQDLLSGYKIIVTAGDQVTKSTYTIQFAPNIDPSLTFSLGTFNEAEQTLTVAYGTTLEELTESITSAPEATFKVYQSDEITQAQGELEEGYLVKSTAGDGLTTQTYKLKLDPATDPRLVSSEIGIFDEETQTIKNIPYGTKIAAFEKGLTFKDKAIQMAFKGKSGEDLSRIYPDTTLTTRSKNDASKTYELLVDPQTMPEIIASSSGVFDPTNLSISDIRFGTTLQDLQGNTSLKSSDSVLTFYRDGKKLPDLSKIVQSNDRVKVSMKEDEDINREYVLSLDPETDPRIVSVNIGKLDPETSTISEIPYGTKAQDIKPTFKGSAVEVRVIAPNQTSIESITEPSQLITNAKGQEQVYTLTPRPNTDASLLKTLGTVDENTKAITDIPFTATLEKFKQALTLPPQATFSIEEIVPKASVSTAKTFKREEPYLYRLIITAGDKETINRYDLGFAPNTQTNLSFSLDQLWEIAKKKLPGK